LYEVKSDIQFSYNLTKSDKLTLLLHVLCYIFSRGL